MVGASAEVRVQPRPAQPAVAADVAPLRSATRLNRAVSQHAPFRRRSVSFSQSEMKANATLEFVVNLVGVGGFLLSLLALYFTRLDKRPRLSVSVSVLEVEDEIMDERGQMVLGPPEKHFFVDISNPGEKRVKVNSVLLRFDGENHHFPHFQADGRKLDRAIYLPPGDNVVYHAFYDELTDWLEAQRQSGKVKLRAVAIDGIGKQYKSSVFRLQSSNSP